MVALNPINNNAADFRDLQIGTPIRHFYYTNHWQRIEERHELNGSPGNALSLHAQWLPGARYIDDHVLRDVVSTPGDSAIDADERKYYLSDANWNTVAIIGKTSTSSDVWAEQERYAYQPYGMPVYLNPDFSAKTTQESSYAVENLFQGFDLASAVTLYPGRYRVLQPALGTWTRRDPAAENGQLSTPAGLKKQIEDIPHYEVQIFPGNPIEITSSKSCAGQIDPLCAVFDSNPLDFSDPLGLFPCGCSRLGLGYPTRPARRCIPGETEVTTTQRSCFGQPNPLHGAFPPRPPYPLVCIVISLIPDCPSLNCGRETTWTCRTPRYSYQNRWQFTSRWNFGCR